MTTPNVTSPAPAAPQAPPAPESAPQNPLRDALNAARNAPEAPAAAPEPIVDATGRHHEPLSGRFIPKEGEPGYVAPKDGEGAAALEAGEGSEVGEGEEGEAPAGAPTEGAEGAGDGVEEGGEPDAALVVAIPGRRPGESVELHAPDAETAEHLRRLSNMAMAGDEVRTSKDAIAQERVALESVQEYIETDPVGFVMENLPADMQDEIALQLLARPEVFDRVAAVVERMMDTDQREMVRLKLENRRLTITGELQQKREEKKMTQANAREIREVVASMVPDGYTPEQTGEFIRACLSDVGQFANVNRLRTVDVKMVPALLASRMAELGLDPVQAAARAAQKRLRTPGTPANGNGNGARPAPPTPAQPKRVTAKTFLEGQAKRQAVAAGAAPAGAGTPPVRVQAPPPGANLKEASAAIRRQLGR